MMKKKLMAGLMAVTFLGGVSVAEANTTENPLPSYEDDSRVMLNGTINEVRNDEFDLDYGDGVITVELDGWGWDDSDMDYLRNGDEITVSGVIDDDLFEGREIKAENLYLNREFVYLSPQNNNNTGQQNRQADMDMWDDNGFEDGSYITMTGVVTQVDGDEFELSSNNGQTLRVDTEDLGYSPFDADGLQRIQNGDRVQVYGEIDDGFFQTRELNADRIISLSQAGNLTQQNQQNQQNQQVQ